MGHRACSAASTAGATGRPASREIAAVWSSVGFSGVYSHVSNRSSRSWWAMDSARLMKSGVETASPDCR
jgi:hypothetical protein